MTVSASAICPKDSAVPRLTAPSAPATALAITNAPRIISRSLLTSLGPPSTSSFAGAPLERRHERGGVERRVLLGQQPLRRGPAAERAEAALAMLVRVVR